MDSEMLANYLNKIGIENHIEPDLHTLKQIHQRQHCRIPFENFDVLNGTTPCLSEEALYQKLVINERGGYCFELNGLLSCVLKFTGFDVRPLLGRIHLEEKPSGRGHFINLVTLGETSWIVDAGFGANTPRAPLPVVFNQEISTDLQTFRFIQDERFGVMLQNKVNSGWRDLYSLDMGHVCDGDIAYGNHFTSTNPDSVFVSNCVATLRTDDGILTLLNNRLSIKRPEGTHEIVLDNEPSYFSALKTYFGIELEMPYQQIANCF
ncbi:N-hydroxyarylamine O-acetyltransferase [Vibrio aerogenes CECT 7868]|uniref:N-hydroxyarylamine O-acetyltransferase n=1 Tax=Vibrio aerogenes CECT 7868 TaxID=1216006 RepID=A0A1M5XDY2_9VIBR|nr:arylamine N-acetyltransferase [Vibrio aerogenes]SHH97969.1 N-hydroxyarylamine O-acetyltransferase [Vibrio aerogenes CECT 7868]